MGLNLDTILTEQDVKVGTKLAEYDQMLTDILSGLTLNEGDPDVSVEFGGLEITFTAGEDIGNEIMYYTSAITDRINLATKVLTTAGAAPAKAMQTTIDKYNQQG